MCGIVEPDFPGRIKGTMICLTCAILDRTIRAWHTGAYKESGEFKTDGVGEQPETKPTSYSQGR